MNLNTPYQHNYPRVEIPQVLPQAYATYTSSQRVSPILAPAASTSQNDSEIDIKLRNVVCIFSLPLHIDLKRVAMNTGNVQFNRNRGVLLKQKRNPPCYVKIFSTGKVYIVGCRSEEECKKASRQIARLIQRSMNKLNEDIRIRNYQVCNIMATCKLPFGVKIEEIAKQYPQTNYEPEISVGLIWKFDDPKATLRIHTTGSVTITGATSEANIASIVKTVFPILKQFACAPRHIDTIQYHRQIPQKRSMSSHRYDSISSEFYINKRSKPSYINRNGAIGQSSSGMYGNKMYFSDEEELENDECLNDLEVDGEYFMNGFSYYFIN